MGPVWHTLGAVWVQFPRNVRQGQPQDAYMTMEAALGDSLDAFGLPFWQIIRHSPPLFRAGYKFTFHILNYSAFAPAFSSGIQIYFSYCIYSAFAAAFSSRIEINSHSFKLPRKGDGRVCLVLVLGVPFALLARALAVFCKTPFPPSPGRSWDVVPHGNFPQV